MILITFKEKIYDSNMKVLTIPSSSRDILFGEYTFKHFNLLGPKLDTHKQELGGGDKTIITTKESSSLC